ncbi:hypothetical protein LIER_40253 [Lithospermum erythrorhizon]|uniref:UBN2_3 domain-containing protein n=1 Tax=Lithospermum erythrorhizon TaxID=34254 RepID=A0AAV3QRP3_LITER
MVLAGVSTSAALPIDTIGVPTTPLVMSSSPMAPMSSNVPILHPSVLTALASIPTFSYSPIPTMSTQISMPLPTRPSIFATPSSSSTAHPPSPPPFTQLNHAHHYISIKLTNTNHLHWHTQLAPFLEGHDLFGYADGSILCPPSHVQDASGYFTLNPAYTFWLRQDKLIMSLLISSMSDETLPLAVGKSSSHAIWDAVKIALANPSFSSHLALQDKLIGLKKNNMTITEYLNHAKSTYDSLAAIVYSRGSAMSFEELRNYLGTHEFVNPVHPIALHVSDGLLRTPPPIAQYAARAPFSSPRGRGQSSRGRFGRAPGLGYSSDRRPPSSSSGHRWCFICESTMHLANDFPHRNHAASPQAFYATPSTQPSRLYAASGPPFHYSSSATPLFGDASITASWIPDTGASHHITPDLASIQNPEPYHGPDRV